MQAEIDQFGTVERAIENLSEASLSFVADQAFLNLEIRNVNPAISDAVDSMRDYNDVMGDVQDRLQDVDEISQDVDKGKFVDNRRRLTICEKAPALPNYHLTM